MRLCLFDTISDAPPAPRLGLVRGRRVVDVHAACVTSLAEHMAPRRAAEIGAALCPPNLLEFLENERHGWRALEDSITRLGDRLDDPSLVSPTGEPVVRALAEARLFPVIPWRAQWSTGTLPAWMGHDLPDDAPLPTTLHSDGRAFLREYLAIIGVPGENLTVDQAWEHVVLVSQSHPSDAAHAALLRTRDRVTDEEMLRPAVASAVSEASHHNRLLIGDVVRTGPALLAEPSKAIIDEDVFGDIVTAAG